MKKKLIIDLKEEITDKHERRINVANKAALHYDPSRPTICTMLMKKDEIEAVTTGNVASRLFKRRASVQEKIEKLLHWINERQLAGDTITETIICEKVPMLYWDLHNQKLGTSTEETQTDALKVSTGKGFDNIKNWTGVRDVVRYGEAVTTDTKAAEVFVKEFRQLTNIHNCREENARLQTYER